MPQIEITKTCGRNQWCTYNSQLILYPKVNAGTAIEIIGILSPPKYVNADQIKEMVKVPTDGTTEVQGLSDAQLKLVRYRVMRRLLEDERNIDMATYFATRVKEIERELNQQHEDPEFTDSVGRIDVNG